MSHRTWRACKLNHHGTPVEALYHLAIGNACHILYLHIRSRVKKVVEKVVVDVGASESGGGIEIYELP